MSAEFRYRYPRPSVTVDVALLQVERSKLKILLIQRKASIFPLRAKSTIRYPSEKKAWQKSDEP